MRDRSPFCPVSIKWETLCNAVPFCLTPWALGRGWRGREAVMPRLQEARGLSPMDVTPLFSVATQAYGHGMAHEDRW